MMVFAANVDGTIEPDIYDNHLNQRQVARLLRERRRQVRKRRLRRWWDCFSINDNLFTLYPTREQVSPFLLSVRLDKWPDYSATTKCNRSVSLLLSSCWRSRWRSCSLRSSTTITGNHWWPERGGPSTGSQSELICNPLVADQSPGRHQLTDIEWLASPNLAIGSSKSTTCLPSTCAD